MKNIYSNKEIRYFNSDLKKINNYLSLYLSCFENFNKNKDYLSWLYKKNPDGIFVGIDVYYSNKLIGQVSGFRSNFFYKGKILKVVIPVNVCIKKEYRGKNLFHNVINKFEDCCKKKGIDLIIGIANQEATPIWINKNKYFFLGPLDVFFLSKTFDLEKIIFNKKIFYSIWDKNKINWRTRNPQNNVDLYTKNNLTIARAKTNIPFINIVSIFPNIKNTKFPQVKNFFNIFIGIIPKNCNQYFKLPNFLKKSPLNFIYKNIGKNKIVLERKNCFFSFLDFDVF